MSLRARTFLFSTLGILLVVVIVGAVFVVLSPRFKSHGQVDSDPVEPGPGYALPVAEPPGAEVATRPGVSGLVDPNWVEEVAAKTGIPARALAAYAGAALVKAGGMPTCGLGWTTLAAIGYVESDHAQHGGAVLADDGYVSPPIYGASLDGESTAHIPDSDAGAIDGDKKFDRAVGPMQLIPQTWRNWHIDGSGDGVEDPQNIDDSVVATSNYLCRASGDMKSESGWRAGVGAYNSSDAYVQLVADVANRYLADSQ